MSARHVQEEARDAVAMQKSVCVDLDGVLARYAGWKGEEHIGEPLPGAKEFLLRLRRLGLRIVIHTARLAVGAGGSHSYAEAKGRIMGWCLRHDMPFDDVQPKTPAIAYVDDRGVQCIPQVDDLSYKIAFEIVQMALDDGVAEAPCA